MNAIHVLLIEDSPVSAQLIRGMLAHSQDAAFDVALADRLAAGIEKVQQDQVDVVLLDLQLPDSDGLDTFFRVRDATEVPIIVLTGTDDTNLAAKAVEEGA